MNFNLKSFVKDAGTVFSRVVQKTEEVLGTAEKTELDPHFEHLCERADNTDKLTTKMYSNTEFLLVPDIRMRVGDFLCETLDKSKPNRPNNLENLGSAMLEAGNNFGTATPYGSMLLKVGQAEVKLGQAEKDFGSATAFCFMQPLRKFLDTEMATVRKELSILENKRLTLDSCKSRVRKARSLLGQQTAECSLRVAQSEFDRQVEITKLLLENIGSSHAAHLRYLQEFVEAQAQFYTRCNSIMQELQRDMASLSPMPYRPSDPIQSFSADFPGHEDGVHRARALYDYEAKDSTELSLSANEVITVQELANKADEDYWLGQRGNRNGKVPKAFLEIIS